MNIQQQAACLQNTPERNERSLEYVNIKINVYNNDCNYDSISFIGAPLVYTNLFDVLCRVQKHKFNDRMSKCAKEVVRPAHMSTWMYRLPNLELK